MQVLLCHSFFTSLLCLPFSILGSSVPAAPPYLPSKPLSPSPTPSFLHLLMFPSSHVSASFCAYTKQPNLHPWSKLYYHQQFHFRAQEYVGCLKAPSLPSPSQVSLVIIRVSFQQCAEVPLNIVKQNGPSLLRTVSPLEVGQFSPCLPLLAVTSHLYTHSLDYVGVQPHFM